jgi:hypothetical protein
VLFCLLCPQEKLWKILSEPTTLFFSHALSASGHLARAQANELIATVPLAIRDRFLMCLTPLRTQSPMQVCGRKYHHKNLAFNFFLFRPNPQSAFFHLVVFVHHRAFML